MRITALERKARGRNYAVHIDGELVLTLSPDVCVQFGLRTGDEIPEERLAAVREAEALDAAMKAALRLLSYRPRSERELRDRLTQKAITPEIRDATIARLRANGLIDDDGYARAFAESRSLSSPRSRRLIAAELRAKGIRRAVADASTADLDDGDAAYRAASRRARTLADRPYAEFRRRLGDFLLRRGFGYELAAETVSRLWSESHDMAAESVEEAAG